MPHKNLRRKTAAYHEAGHAVVAHVLGWKTARVTIEKEQPHFAPLTSPMDAHFEYHLEQGGGVWPAELLAMYCLNYATVCMAGFVAQRRKCRGSNAFTGVDDIEQAKAILQRAYPERDDPAILAVLIEAEKQARKIIRDEWGKVENVAQTLLERETIQGIEFFDVMHR